jgi:mRNA interferase YafQ
MKHLSQTKQFSKDVKRMARRGKDIEKLKAVVRLLAEGRSPDLRYRDHPLSGQWNQSRDCHIEADWILIYSSDQTSLCMERTGTHSDLFE